jgi:DNA-binding response OmpR family regulator
LASFSIQLNEAETVKPKWVEDEMRILVIEDNKKIAHRLCVRFKEEGFQVDVANRGQEGEQLAAEQEYDAIVLDVLLPDHDGVQICKNLRKRHVATPILVLTALGTTADKVAGLEAGADDYLTKPFDYDELIARIRALARRGTAGEAVTLTFGDIELDLAKRTLTRAGRAISVTAREFCLMEYLLRRPERVATKSAIGANVWDMNFEDESNVIEVYVSRIRKKLEQDGEARVIHTVPGAGYILSERASEESSALGVE